MSAKTSLETLKIPIQEMKKSKKHRHKAKAAEVPYHKQQVQTHILDVTRRYPSLSSKLKEYSHPSGVTEQLWQITGTLPLTSLGQRCDLPIEINLPPDYPSAPPSVRISPQPQMHSSPYLFPDWSVNIAALPNYNWEDQPTLYQLIDKICDALAHAMETKPKPRSFSMPTTKTAYGGWSGTHYDTQTTSSFQYMPPLQSLVVDDLQARPHDQTQSLPMYLPHFSTRPGQLNSDANHSQETNSSPEITSPEVVPVDSFGFVPVAYNIGSLQIRDSDLQSLPGGQPFQPTTHATGSQPFQPTTGHATGGQHFQPTTHATGGQHFQPATHATGGQHFQPTTHATGGHPFQPTAHAMGGQPFQPTAHATGGQHFQPTTAHATGGQPFQPTTHATGGQPFQPTTANATGGQPFQPTTHATGGQPFQRTAHATGGQHFQPTTHATGGHPFQPTTAHATGGHPFQPTTGHATGGQHYQPTTAHATGGQPFQPTTRATGGQHFQPTTHTTGSQHFQPTTHATGGQPFQPTTLATGGQPFQPTTRAMGGQPFQPTTHATGRQPFQPTTHATGRQPFQPTTHATGGHPFQPTTTHATGGQPFQPAAHAVLPPEVKQKESANITNQQKGNWEYMPSNLPDHSQPEKQKGNWEYMPSNLPEYCQLEKQKGNWEYMPSNLPEYCQLEKQKGNYMPSNLPEHSQLEKQKGNWEYMPSNLPEHSQLEVKVFELESKLHNQEVALRHQLFEKDMQLTQMVSEKQALQQQNLQKEAQLQKWEDMASTLQKKEKEMSEKEGESEALRQEVQQLQVQLQQLEQQLQHTVREKQSPQGGAQRHEFWSVSRDELECQQEFVASGAWGYVMKGTFRGQIVAVKCMHENIVSPHNIDLFRREISIMSQIRHPNLVLFIAAVIDDRGSPLVILELLGPSLRKAYEDDLIKCSKFPILRDVATALNYLHLHQEPIVHRDVSSANVLLEKMADNRWKAKLSDFGSANLVRAATTLAPGAIVYSAPEALNNTIAQSPSMDVYSYGVLTCELATSHFPDPEQLDGMLQRVHADQPTLHRLIVQCIDQSPTQRLTMGNVIDALNDMMAPHVDVHQ